MINIINDLKTESYRNYGANWTKEVFFRNLFSKGVCFKTFYRAGPFLKALRQSCWRNRTRGSRQWVSPVLLAKQDTWHGCRQSCWWDRGHVAWISPFPLAKYFRLYENYKFQPIVTFYRNVRLRPIICQNVRNWRRNPLENYRRGFGQLIFSKKQI